MSERPVVIFGAGATKACRGPLTSEILPQAFELESIIRREDFFPTLERFLTQNFNLPVSTKRRDKSHFPPLPMLISLLDIAIDRKHSFGKDWTPVKLGEVQEALNYVIFALLEHTLQVLSDNLYLEFLQRMQAASGRQPSVISLNYDLIADNTLMALSERTDEGFGFPDYGCDVGTPEYRSQRKFGSLYKLHGSLNWLYCPSCQRLDVGLAESGRSMTKMVDELFVEEQLLKEHMDLRRRYSCRGSPCSDCATYVRPVIITPTHLKDYRNPHISQTWYKAERALRESDRAFIVGYSLPEDDVDVTYLLKRGLSHLDARQITVIGHDPEEMRSAREHPEAWRYTVLFGGVDWHPEGFKRYLEGRRDT